MKINISVPFTHLNYVIIKKYTSKLVTGADSLKMLLNEIDSCIALFVSNIEFSLYFKKYKYYKTV